MAKVTITFADRPGSVDIQVQFDPPLKAGERGTYAQRLAVHLQEYLSQELKEAAEPSSQPTTAEGERT